MRKICISILYVILMLLYACSSKEQGNILDAVPADFALVLEGNSPANLHEVLNSNGESLELLHDFTISLNTLDSLMVKEEKLLQYYQNAHTACLLSTHDNVPVSAIIMVSNKSLSNNDIKGAIESSGLSYETHEIGKIPCFRLPEIGDLLVVKHRFLLYSENEQLLQKMLEQLEDSEKIYSNPDFKRVQSTLGKTVQVHLYINHDVMGTLITNMVSSKYQGVVSEFFSQFKGMAALDVQSKPDALMTNGYSVPKDSLSSLRPLKYQMPVHNTVVNVLPNNTKLMLHYCMSDYVSYWEEFSDKEQVARFNNRYKVELEQQLITCLSEIAYCVFGSSDKPVFVSRMNDPAAVMQFMDRLCTKAGVSESIAVQGYTVKNLSVKNFVPNVFGKSFQNITSCCYAIVDQYLVVANDFRTVQDVISGYRSGRTLDLSENFKSFQDNMLESGNVCLYWVNAELQSALQLAASKDLVYTSFSMQKMFEIKEESNAQWKVNLNAPLNGKPYFVRDAKGQPYIVAFDSDNMMYLIDNKGNILWKKQISEVPMSEIELVVYQPDGQGQMLFNTANYLELIDFSGNNVEGYPRHLLCEASNGLAVFDYEGTKSYRVIICGTDKFVYNYNLQGDETPGWNRHRTEELVTKPVQHLVVGNRDILAVTDINGTVRILDRQGRIRIPLKADLHKSQGADFYENRTNHKGVILTSDEVGQLLYIAEDGGLARTDFGTYSNKHYFLYEDFNGDQDPDFIYLDGKQLRVFNRFKKVLYSHDFDTEISCKPVVYHLSRNKCLLGLVSESARELYLIDKNGNMTVSSGLINGTNFAIGSLKGNNEINLLGSDGNCLFNYLIY